MISPFNIWLIAISAEDFYIIIQIWVWHLDIECDKVTLYNSEYVLHDWWSDITYYASWFKMVIMCIIHGIEFWFGSFVN